MAICESSEKHLKYSSLISQETKKERNMTYRLPSEIRRSIGKGYFLLSFEENELTGWIERTPIWKNWSGLFCLYVYPQYRGNRIGSQLLETATEKEKEKIIWAATLNPQVAKKLTSLGYTETPLKKHPPIFILNLLKERYLSLGLVYNFPHLIHPYRFFIHYPENDVLPVHPKGGVPQNNVEDYFSCPAGWRGAKINAGSLFS